MRPLLAVVHLWRRGQPEQADAKETVFLVDTGRVRPAGQVTVWARVNPSGTAGRSGQGLMIGWWPAWSSSWSISPVP